MLTALVIGNGESRRAVDLGSFSANNITIGCNALHREIVVDHLVCCDRRMVDEAVKNDNIADTLIYVRDSWYHYFRKILKNKRIQHLPTIPLRGELKRDNPDHWGSGSYAILLAAHLGCERINLLGFDLYSNRDRVNNIYKGTQNYANEQAQAVDYSYWVYHTALIISSYPAVEFVIHNHASWVMPKEWQKNNVKFLAL